MKIQRSLVHNAIAALLLILFGYIGCGFGGIVLGFWVMMLWYSVRRIPRRWELLFLSIIGIIGGLILMPRESWRSGFIGIFFSVLFVLTALSPLLFRKRRPRESAAFHR